MCRQLRCVVVNAEHEPSGMPARLRVVLFGTLAVVLLATVALSVFRPEDDQAPTAESTGIPSSPSEFQGSTMPRGVPAPDFALRDQDGERLALDDLRGRPFVATFLYASCRDTCPLEAQQIRGALDRLADDGEQVPAVAFSVDPDTDTPSRARRFLIKQRVYGQMRFVVGSRSELTPIWKGFFIQPQLEDAEHQARVVLVDAKGMQRVGYPANQLRPEAVAEDLQRLLAEARN